MNGINKYSRQWDRLTRICFAGDNKDFHKQYTGCQRVFGRRAPSGSKVSYLLDESPYRILGI